MEVLEFTYNLHYPIISEWWKAYKWPILPQDHLPKKGYIVYHEKKPIIAGFVYRTDSSFGLFEWIVANPEIKGLKRTLAFGFLVDSVVKYSKEIGIKTLFSSISNENLKKRFLAEGFILADSNMSNFIRSI